MKASELRKLWASPTLAPASAARRGPMAGSAAEVGTFVLGRDSVTVGVEADLVFGRANMSFVPVTVGIGLFRPGLVSLLTAAHDKRPG